MNADRWRAIEALFHGARAVSPGERAAYVRDLSGGDEEMVREVTELLDEDSGGDNLDTPLAFPQQEDAEPEPGKMLGSYRIVRRIGRGGMGSVFLAERADDVFEKKVALKTMSGGGPGLARRFQKERQILASLEHPNITRLLDGGVTADKTPFLVMEFVDGQTLSERAPSLDLTAKVRLMASVCDAVHYAHQRLVIHRDLKPGNVVVTKDGTPKLLDFGIAKLLGQGEGGGTREDTVTQVAMMTPKYASPEQMLGENVSTLSDIYSLGVMLDELVGPGAPRDLRKIANKARQTIAADRYAAAAGMRDDLLRFLNGDAVLPQEDTIRYRLGKFVSLNRVAVTGASLVVLAVVLGAAISLWQARVARLERNRAEAINGFLLRLLENADPERSQLVEQGAELKVVDVLDRAASELEREWAGEAATEGALRHVLTRSYLGLAKYEKARQQAAIELSRAIDAHGKESQQAAEAHRNLAAAHSGLLDYPKANPEWRAAIDLFARYPEARARGFRSMGEFASSLVSEGKHSEAVKYGEDALAGFKAMRGEEGLEVGQAYCGAGEMYYDLKQNDRQREYFTKGIAILKKLPQTPFGLGECLHNLAVHHADNGDYTKSAELNGEAIEIIRRLGGNDHLYVAVASISRAVALRKMNLYEEAITDAEEALRITLKLYPRTHDWPAYVLTMYGGIECEAGRVDAGLLKLRESYASRKGYYSPDSTQLASLKGTFGKCLAKNGEYAQGEELLRGSYEIYLKNYGADNRFTISAKKDLEEAALAKASH